MLGVKEGEEHFRDEEYQHQHNPVCVELLYNMPFLNNEYFFEDIQGTKVESVMEYERPYLARDNPDGQKLSSGEKYLLKTHTEEIPTISGDISFDTIIPFTIEQDDDSRVNRDIVDATTTVITGVSYIEEKDPIMNDSGYSDFKEKESYEFDAKELKKEGANQFTVINNKEHLMTTRTVPTEGDTQP